MSQRKKIFFKRVSIVIVFFIITFLFLLKSPLHIWNGSNSYTDSSVFKTIALMMDKGCIPYRDSFDHKGPYIYIKLYRISNFIL